MTTIDEVNGTEPASQKLAQELAKILNRRSVGDHFSVPPSAGICYALELVLPRVLRSHYPEWEKESLDGIFVARATKTHHMTAELVGTCILISDQTVTPFLVELRLSENESAIAVPRLRLGEPGGGALSISGPPCNSTDAERLLDSLLERLEDVEWCYSLPLP